MRGSKTGFFFLTLLLALPWGKARAADPDPQQVLREASNNASASYSGKMVSLVQNGKKGQFWESRILFSPPNLYRKEFYSVGGRLEKIVVSDGTHEWIYFPGRKTVWEGDASKILEKGLSDDAEWQLFLQNYTLELKDGDRVAGRPAWVVAIHPKKPGKPETVDWIDKKAPVILESKQFSPDGALAVESHFTDIEILQDVPEDRFRFEVPPGAALRRHGLDPYFLSLEDLRKSGVKAPKLPQELPEGFVFESANYFKVKGKEVTHLRFTDGLIAISLFEGSAPFAAEEKNFGWQPLEPDFGRMAQSRSGKVLNWKSRNRYYVLVGDLSADLLGEIAKSLR